MSCFVTITGADEEEDEEDEHVIDIMASYQPGQPQHNT